MIRKKLRPREITLGLVAVLIFLILLVFYIWHQVESIRLGREISRLELDIKRLQEEIDLLQVEKTALLRLERIERIARQDLGLREPREDQIEYWQTNGKIRKDNR